MLYANASICKNSISWAACVTTLPSWTFVTDPPLSHELDNFASWASEGAVRVICHDPFFRLVGLFCPACSRIDVGYFSFSRSLFRSYLVHSQIVPTYLFVSMAVFFVLRLALCAFFHIILLFYHSLASISTLPIFCGADVLMVYSFLSMWLTLPEVRIEAMLSASLEPV